MIFSTDLENRGFFPRFNPYSRCKALSFHAIDAMYHAFNDKKLGRLTGPVLERVYQKANYAASDLAVKSEAFEKLRKSGVYKGVTETVRGMRKKILGRKVENKSWSKVNKVDKI